MGSAGVVHDLHTVTFSLSNPPEVDGVEEVGPLGGSPPTFCIKKTSGGIIKI